MSDTLVDPVQSAKAAGLRYTNDNQPGIRRQRVGKGFSYFDVEGSRIPSSPERDRIKALAIPQHGLTYGFAHTPKVICRRQDGMRKDGSNTATIRNGGGCVTKLNLIGCYLLAMRYRL